MTLWTKLAMTLALLLSTVYLAGQSENPNDPQPDGRDQGCGFQLDQSKEEWKEYHDQISQLRQQRSTSTDTMELLPVVMVVVRDDDGNVPYYYQEEWRNWVFSKTNHYLMESVNARLYLADLRYIDSTAIYNTTENSNSVLVEDVYGPFCDTNATNIVLAPGNGSSFALFPNNTLTPQAFMKINYIGIQHDGETPEHELGHFLGLRHTHQGTEFGNDYVSAEHVPRSGNNSNCSDTTKGDGLCDTPADPCVGFGCSSNSDTLDIFGNPYAADTTNIMGYWITYRDHFTADQDSVMADGLAYRLADVDYDIQGFPPTTSPAAPVIDSFENTHLYNYIGWNNVADNLGYLVERSSESDSTGFLPIYDWESYTTPNPQFREMINGGTHDDVTYFLDKSIIAGVDYWYRVIAVNSPDQYSNVVYIESDYDNSYCNLVTPCSTGNFVPDSVKILDLSEDIKFFDDDYYCDDQWDIHAEQQIVLHDDQDYNLVQWHTINQVSQAYLNFFIDLNQDGDFEDQDEWVIENVQVSFVGGGGDTTQFNIPTQAEYGLRPGRIIFSTLYNLGMFMPIDNACEFSQSRFGFDIEVDIQQNPCVAIQNLMGTQTIDQDFIASDSIVSSQVIDANVNYSAANTIQLEQGFEVLIGKDFQAVLDGCDFD